MNDCISVEPADVELVTRSVRGDLSAFNQIVDRYQSQVYNVAARTLGSRVAAEDVTQETFISAYKAISGFRGGSLRAWLLRIARNQCFDHLRSIKRRPESSLEEAFEDTGFVQPASADSLPETQALAAELGRAISRAIHTLPLDQRITLLTIDVQGLSYEETAEAFGVSIGTVKSRLSRARSKVRDLLAREAELLPEQFRRV